MKIHLIAVGNKMPAWVETGAREYQKRLPKNFDLIVTEVPLAKRTKSSQDAARLCEKEGKALLAAVPAGAYLVALDVKGKAHATETLAERFRVIMESGRDLAMLVGGPDGLSPECLESVEEIWSLSALTMPHTLVRIVVAEQVYRVWSVLNRHPYHRE